MTAQASISEKGTEIQGCNIIVFLIAISYSSSCSRDAGWLKLFCSQHFWAKPHTCSGLLFLTYSHITTLASSIAALHNPVPFCGPFGCAALSLLHCLWLERFSFLLQKANWIFPLWIKSPIWIYVQQKKFYSPITLKISLHAVFCYFQVCSYEFLIICIFLIVTWIPSCFIFAFRWGQIEVLCNSPRQISVCINGEMPTEASYLSSAIDSKYLSLVKLKIIQL